MLTNTSNKKWFQAFKLSTISFLVLWSLPQNNSHNEGNIVLVTCRALQVCTIVLYCSFGLLACATEILPSSAWVSNHFTFFQFEKRRDMLMNTPNKQWLQALKSRTISFLVLWSLPQSNSHKKGNIKLRTCRSLQVCRIILYCSFGFLACATEILPSCVLVSHFFTFFYFEKVRDMLMNTSSN